MEFLEKAIITEYNPPKEQYKGYLSNDHTKQDLVDKYLEFKSSIQVTFWHSLEEKYDIVEINGWHK